MSAIPWLMAFLVTYDGAMRFIRRFDADVWEGDCFNGMRWIAWGTIRAGAQNRPNVGLNRRYVFVKLPSYDYKLNFMVDGYRMMQRCLMWTGHFMGERASRTGWYTTWIMP